MRGRIRFDSTFPNLQSGLGQGLNGIQSVAEDLLKCIHAYQNICATAAKHTRNNSVYQYFESNYETEVRAKSLELAINFRIWDEKASEAEQWRKILAEITSERIGHMIEPDKEELSLREACNKIVHAKRAVFQTIDYHFTDSELEQPVQVSASDTRVTISGAKYGKPWKCKVDVLEFSICCHEAVDRWISGDF